MHAAFKLEGALELGSDAGQAGACYPHYAVWGASLAGAALVGFAMPCILRTFRSVSEWGLHIIGRLWNARPRLEGGLQILKSPLHGDIITRAEACTKQTHTTTHTVAGGEGSGLETTGPSFSLLAYRDSDKTIKGKGSHRDSTTYTYVSTGTGKGKGVKPKKVLYNGGQKVILYHTAENFVLKPLPLPLPLPLPMVAWCQQKSPLYGDFASEM
jgi:hypothetical protein